MREESFELFTLGHSLAVGLKVAENAWFDSTSAEGSTWSKNYSIRVEKYLHGMLQNQLLDKLMRLFQELVSSDYGLYLNLTAYFGLDGKEVLFIKDNLIASGDSKMLRGIIQNRLGHYFPKVINKVIAHNGERAQGFSISETNHNAALDYPKVLHNCTSLPHVVVTHLGVNDLRSDHRQTRAILEGSQYLEKLKKQARSHEVTEGLIEKACQELSHFYSQTSVDLFKYWCRNGNDKKLLRFSFQIFSINIRLAHGKAYAHVSEKIIAALKKQIASNIKSLPDKAPKLMECFNSILKEYFSFHDEVNALEMFVNENKDVNSKSVARYFYDWQKLSALYKKKPATDSAAEHMAKGDIESALVCMRQHGVSQAQEILDKLSKGEATLFDAMDMVSAWYAPLCRHLPTQYCHLVSPNFHNAYGIFSEKVLEGNAALLAKTWGEVSAIFPNTYCLALDPYTKVFQANEHPNADGLHWTNKNYKEASLPIALAIVSIMHGIKASVMQDLVTDRVKKIKGKGASRVKPIDELISFSDDLSNSGYKIRSGEDFVDIALKKCLGKMKMSPEIIEKFVMVAKKADAKKLAQFGLAKEVRNELQECLTDTHQYSAKR